MLTELHLNKYTKIIRVHLRNKGTNANLLADRAEVYFMMKRIDDCIKDCEASLALDQVGHCTLGTFLRIIPLYMIQRD